MLHVNDSQMPLGSNRDRHALLPKGELGREGLAAFLSEPRFDGLPALLEGGEKQGADTAADRAGAGAARGGAGGAGREVGHEAGRCEEAGAAKRGSGRWRWGEAARRREAPRIDG